MTTAKQRAADEARERLLEWIDPDRTVYTILRHVSRSGMLRVISVVQFNEAGDPIHLGWQASKMLGWRYDEQREGVRVTGAGMDMGFHLVYTLSRVLYADGRTDPDAGYRLRQRWL